MELIIKSLKENKVLGIFIIICLVLFILLNLLFFKIINIRDFCISNDFWNLSNSILVNILAAYLFYLWAVYIPEYRRKQIIVSKFKQSYLDFKRRIIEVFLQAANLQSSILNEQERLTNVKEFKEFFQKSDSRGGDAKNKYIYTVMNGLEENNYYISDIVNELGILKQEINFVLSLVQLGDKDTYNHLKNFSVFIQDVEARDRNEGDYVKFLTDKLWQVMAGWSLGNGYSDNDITIEIINDI